MMKANTIVIKVNKTEINTKIIVILSKSRVRVDYQNIDIYSSITAIIPVRLYFLLVQLHFPSYSRLYILRCLDILRSLQRNV